MVGVENCSNIGRRIISSKEKLDWDDPKVNGYQYSFQFPLNPERKEGKVRVIYRSLEYFNQRGGNEFLYKLLVEKIERTNTIIHLKEFFPNGKWLNKDENKFMRQGFGTEILNFLILEGLEKGAKAIYVATGKDKIEMRNFLINKHGFEPVDRRNSNNMGFFKILDL